MDRIHVFHYHIRWSDKTTLDWESFDTIPDAETNAKKLVQSSEAYTIEEHNGDCLRCRVGVIFFRKA